MYASAVFSVYSWAAIGFTVGATGAVYALPFLEIAASVESGATDADVGAMLPGADVLVSSVYLSAWAAAGAGLRLIHATGAGCDAIAFDAVPVGCKVANVYEPEGPIAESFGNWANLKLVLLALFGAMTGQAVIGYCGLVYMLLFLTQTLKLAPVTANLLVAGALTQEAIDVAVILNALRALGPGRTSGRRTMPIAAAGSLQADHAQLEPSLDRLREIADALDGAEGAAAVAMISEADRIVTDIVTHERDDESEVYPRVAKFLARHQVLVAPRQFIAWLR